MIERLRSDFCASGPVHRPLGDLKSWCSKRQRAVDAGAGRQQAAPSEPDASAEVQGKACEPVNGALQVARVTQNESLQIRPIFRCAFIATAQANLHIPPVLAARVK